LNQWELLQEFGSSLGCTNNQLVLESAWRSPNWPIVRDALTQLEQACPKEYAWKVSFADSRLVSLFSIYLFIYLF
jgi:transformation/transcription domain-associated protein